MWKNDIWLYLHVTMSLHKIRKYDWKSEITLHSEFVVPKKWSSGRHHYLKQYPRTDNRRRNPRRRNTMTKKRTFFKPWTWIHYAGKHCSREQRTKSEKMISNDIKWYLIMSACWHAIQKRVWKLKTKNAEFSICRSQYAALGLNPKSTPCSCKIFARIVVAAAFKGATPGKKHGRLY